MKTIIVISVSMFASVALAGDPTTRPLPGLAVSAAEYQKRLDALNAKSTTRPADAPLVSESDRGRFLASRQAILVDAQRRETDALDRIAADRPSMAEVDQSLADVQSRGRAAEQLFNDLVRQYDIDAGIAYSPVTEMFSSDTSNEVIGNSHTIGTISNVGAQEAAIEAVETKYGPEIAKARSAVSILFDQQKRLISQHNTIAVEMNNCNVQVLRARREQAEATRAISNLMAVRSTTRPTTQP